MKKLFTLSIIIVTYIVSNAQTDCKPATITNVEKEGSGNRITWNMPASGEEITISHNGIFSGKYIGDVSSFGVYHRFTPENLAAINGGKLAQIVFAPMYAPFQTEPGHTYTIQVYQGGMWGEVGNRNPGTLIFSQDISNNDLLFNQENTISLETPVNVDATQELWIGYFCTNIDSVQSEAKQPAGIDDGPCKDELGNVMFYQNQWCTLLEVASSSNRNWCIKGRVQTIEGESVNIYFNGDKIKSNFSGTTYFHDNPTGEEYCYKLEVNCSEYLVSPFSNEFCIPGVGIKENGEMRKFTVYPNPATNELRITNYELRDGIIEIYDVYGRKQKAEGRKQNGEFIINISNLSVGVYLVRLIDEQGFSVQKFIKE